MRVKHLRVQNFTSLIDVDLRDLPNLVVFIGKNSSGKSNLIDALALLFIEFGTDVDRGLGSPDDYQHLFPNHDIQVSVPSVVGASVSLTAEEWTKLLSIDENAARALEPFELFLSKRIANVDGVVHWQTQDVATTGFEVVLDGEVVSGDVLSIPGQTDVGPQEFLNRLGELMRSSFQVIHTTDDPRSWSDRFSERPTIIGDEHVAELCELSQSRGNRRQPWTRMIQQYQEIAPNRQRPAGVASSIQVEEGELSFPIGMTGEGSQAMVRLVDQLERGSPVMAIEEPETHLHPALIKRMGRLLAESSEKGKQIFICTHSPFLVEQSSLGNFFVVKKEREGTQASPMGDIDSLRELLLDIGMRPSDVLFSDAVLLVEGLSDEMFVVRLSDKVNVPLAARSVKIVRVGGFPRGRRHIEFWAKVGRDAGLPIFLILEIFLILDENAREEAEGAISKEQIPREHCLILDSGNLEDYYSQRVLDQVLSAQFDVELEGPIPIGQRVEKLRALLSRKAGGKNAWKPVVAEEVVKTMTLDEAESETEEIVAFLRKIYHEVGGE